MCGIAGFIHKTGRLEKDTLRSMMARISHRGPDGHGEWHCEKDGWSIALGHTRLSIIDLAGGKQPMANEDGTVQITFNGEIYNYISLREPLRKNHQFRTQSDTEVIIHHYEEKGLRSFEDLNGIFGFAIWDEKNNSLVLVRDRVGIKPLYYASLPDGGLVFASELTAILAHPKVSKTLSMEALQSYFFLDYVAPPNTVIAGVKKLYPGHSITWKNGKLLEPTPYWSLPNTSSEPSQYKSLNKFAETFWERLDEAVCRQLVSDVPVGVFLSGGIDSSAIAFLAQKNTPHPVQTFSIGFEDKNFDETSYAKQVAQQIKSHHRERILSEKILLETIDRALAVLDEPLADPSLIPTFLLSQLASEHVKVVLGGDGGDELWGGYPTYQAHKMANIYSRLPSIFKRQLIPYLVGQLPIKDSYQSIEWKLKRFAQRWEDQRIPRHLRWMSSLDRPYLSEAFGDNCLPYTILDHWQISDADWLNAILRLDFNTFLPGSVLTKVDRASMANGLEVRPPLLDSEFVDWTFQIESKFKLRGYKSKYLFKLAAKNHLPKLITHRRKKGFAIPLAKWTRGPLAPLLAKVFEDSPLWGDPNLNPLRKTLSAFNTAHQNKKKDGSRPLWALLILDKWLKKEGLEVKI